MRTKIRKTSRNIMSLYPISIEQHTEGGYFASCPMLQGCHAEGETLGETIDNIQDVIRLHIEARHRFNGFVSTVELPRSNSIRFTLPMPIKA